jgi:hypothetical protein
MTTDQQKRLRSLYHSLLGQQKIFDDLHQRDPNTEGTPVKVLADLIHGLATEFPTLVTPFRAEDFFAYHTREHTPYYRVAGIRAYLATILGTLKVAIEDEQATPVTQTRDFGFMHDSDLRKCVERDYAEIQRAFIAQCWKSVIILSGGTIEAILTDLLLRDLARATGAASAPKQHDISRWDLRDLIKVAVELGLVSAGVEKLSHSVREYRNLVHPGNELRNKLTFDAEEAKIALEVVHILHRDLSP